jgi:hypothetical protein
VWPRSSAASEDGVNDATGVPLQDRDQTAAGRVPDPHSLILGGRSDGLAVRAEGHAVDPVPVARHHRQELTLVQLPEADRVIGVIAAKGDPAAVGAHGQAEHASARVAWRRGLLAGCGIRHMNRHYFVPATRPGMST